MIGHNFLLYANTLRYLRPIQLWGRLRNIYRPRPRFPSCNVSRLSGPLKPFITSPSSILAADRFDFLNQSRQLSFPDGWNGRAKTHLWLYNLHYFDGLLDPNTITKLKTDMIVRWIGDNPPGTGVGWEPYPTSLRITNWIKWHLSGGQLPADAFGSLACQADYVSRNLEYHLLGNHLFANAKALVFAGCFFDGPSAQTWLNKGLRILDKQIPEQFLADGGHFELSPTYHALLTEDLLDIINILRTFEITVPHTWDAFASRAITWLRVMTRPDGNVPLFNDAAYGVTPNTQSVIDYAVRLGIKTLEAAPKGLTDLSDSGYFRFDGENYTLFGDAGQIGPDYIPGHAHCDMLSFELFANGSPLIVDTGTSTYETGNRRQLERSVASHNTVQIGDAEQSEIWASFRVARRARITHRVMGEDYLVAELSDYKKSRHRREFNFSNDSIRITDHIYPRQHGTVSTARLHFYSAVEISLEDCAVKANSTEISFEGVDKIWIEEYQYAPEFNKLIDAKVVCASFCESLETIIHP